MRCIGVAESFFNLLNFENGKKYDKINVSSTYEIIKARVASKIFSLPVGEGRTLAHLTTLAGRGRHEENPSIEHINCLFVQGPLPGFG